jgi:hypothetical protein
VTETDDEEHEQLGWLGRILAIPLVPFVALWEAAKIGARALASGVRWLGSTLTSLWRSVRELLLNAAGWLARTVRAAFRTVRQVAQALGRPLLALARALITPVRAFGRGVAALAKRCVVAIRMLAKTTAAALRAAGRAALALTRRALVALRAAARVLAQPLRAAARAIAALAKRALLAMRAFAKTTAAALRAAGRAALALTRRALVALRAAARVLAQPLRAAARWCTRALATARSAVTRIARAAARVVRVTAVHISAIARHAMRVIDRSLLQPLAAITRWMVAGARRTLQLLIVGLTPIFRGGRRLIAVTMRLIATSTSRFVRWVARPVGRVGRRGHGLWNSTIDKVRRARRWLNARIRASTSSAGSIANAHWRRTRPVVQRARIAVRRGLEDARTGVKRWARSVSRNRRK